MGIVFGLHVFIAHQFGPRITGRTPEDPLVQDSLMDRFLGDVLILANRNYVPLDFIVLDIDCNPSCPIILGRPFLRTIGGPVLRCCYYLNKPPTYD